jgi:hypothetical protein
MPGPRFMFQRPSMHDLWSQPLRISRCPRRADLGTASTLQTVLSPHQVSQHSQETRRDRARKWTLRRLPGPERLQWRARLSRWWSDRRRARCSAAGPGDAAERVAWRSRSWRAGDRIGRRRARGPRRTRPCRRAARFAGAGAPVARHDLPAGGGQALSGERFRAPADAVGAGHAVRLAPRREGGNGGQGWPHGDMRRGRRWSGAVGAA